MYKTVAASAFAVLTSFAAQAQGAATGAMQPKEPVYVSHATSSTELAGEIPCSMFKRNADGSWLIKGTVIMSGMTMTNTSFGGGRESQIFESRCGNSQNK
jgi:hypothetical protein